LRTLLLAVAISLAARAEIIDRIAVSVGTRVITTSDIERQIRVAAFVSGVKPDLSAAARRQADERMIDQKLIQMELETARYPEPAPADLDAAFNEFKAKYYPAPEQYRRALAESGVTEEDVKELLHWQRRFTSFVGIRFRPSTSVSDSDIAQYFQSTVAPAARAANPGASVTLDEFRDRIAEKLTADRVDRQTEEWLLDVRKRTEIVFHEEAFR
jgi:peptidyl-prolyl cis-trans isomerase SurA